MTVVWSWNATAEAFWARMEHDPPPLDTLWRELRPPATRAYNAALVEAQRLPSESRRPEPKPQPHPRPRPKPTRNVDPFTARQEQIGLNILNRINRKENQ